MDKATLTANCLYAQDVPEPLRTIVSKEPLVMLDDERGYPLEACRGIAVALLGMAVFALACFVAWMAWRGR